MKSEPIQPQFLTQRQGRDFVLYPGLVDAAHRSGLRSITTSLLQAPAKDNDETAICRAVATFVDAAGDEYTFSGIGDANQHNVGKVIAMHRIRMAETRAKARALRDALNISVAAIEELAGDYDGTPERGASRETGEIPPVEQTPPVPATKAHYDTLLALAEQITNTCGKDVSDKIVDGLSAVTAENLISRFKVTLAAGKAPVPPVPSADKATQQQIDKIHKLQAALGRPAMVANDITADDAVKEIGELVRLFNSQQKASKAR
jgi:hypothetical protein